VPAIAADISAKVVAVLGDQERVSRGLSEQAGDIVVQIL
jgi:hypothetical protein